MKKTVLFVITFFVTIGILFIIQKPAENKETEIVQWNSPGESFTLGFFVRKGGQLCMEGQINGITGIFVFDTGAEMSLINEKYITAEDLKLASHTINDAKALKQTRDLYKVNNFELGAIKIKDLNVFPADSLVWKDPKGIFYKQDSIVGVIGNNIISKFIWDFDMVNRRVTVSRSKSYCDSIADSLAISLISVEKHKEILVRINGKLRRLSLDFGSHFPISLSDSIPNRKKSEGNTRYFTETKSGLNHLDSSDGLDSQFDFVDIKLGAFEFKEIQCLENDDSALLGIPLVWSFKRVVIDFMNNKAYFISLNESTGEFGVRKFNRQTVFNGEKLTILHSKPEGMQLVIQNRSGSLRYVGYGKLMVYDKNSKLDSIVCCDSIRLPDGKIKIGPVTLRIDSINQHQNKKLYTLTMNK